MEVGLARAEAFSIVPEGSRLRWTGPGRTAFLGAFGLSGESSADRAAARLLGPRDGWALGGSPSASARELLRYFAQGGRAAWVLDDPRLEKKEGGFERLGEDGGPGYRSGLYALADIEEVGTIAVLGCCGEAALEEILGFASRRDDVLFFFDAPEDALRPLENLRSPPGDPLSRSLPVRIFRRNAAALVSRASAEPEREAAHRAEPSLGELAAFVESWDFEPEPPFVPRNLEPPAWLSREQALYLCAFRRFQGIRRSIELGTRWAIFELNGPLLWKGIEREISAFLRALADLGLLEAPRRTDAFRVECVPLAVECRKGAEEESPDAGAKVAASRPSEMGISIRVHARLAEPYASALARGFSCGRSEPRREDRAAGDAGSG